jgi:hypothetical protein
MVTERLGHSTTAHTQDAYQHVLPGKQRDTARRFRERLYRPAGDAAQDPDEATPRRGLTMRSTNPFRAEHRVACARSVISGAVQTGRNAGASRGKPPLTCGDVAEGEGCEPSRLSASQRTNWLAADFAKVFPPRGGRGMCDPRGHSRVFAV